MIQGVRHPQAGVPPAGYEEGRARVVGGNGEYGGVIAGQGKAYREITLSYLVYHTVACANEE